MFFGQLQRPTQAFFTETTIAQIRIVHFIPLAETDGSLRQALKSQVIDITTLNQHFAGIQTVSRIPGTIRNSDFFHSYTLFSE